MTADVTRYSTSDPNTPDGGPARRLRLASYKWRRGRRAGPSGRRTFWVTLWALGYLVLSGLLVWVCLWLWPPRAASLVLVGAGYETNLAVPQNVYGRAGLDGFKALARSGRFGRPGRVGLAWGPRTVRKRDPWDRGLTALPGKTAVVVLALHGGSDASGGYLLPDDADADPAGNNRVRLEDVIARFERAPFQGKNVVLVLDATRAAADWPLGMLRNDFARALEALNDRVERVPNLVVMSASGPGQRSWGSPEWRESVFAHFLIDGLKGMAAGEDGRVDAAELFRFARLQTSTWVSTHRGSVQKPVLLPLGDSGLARASRMELAVARPEDVPPPPAAELTADVDAPELTAAWGAYDRLRAESPPPAAYSPQLWSRYVASVLRFDELHRAGDRASAQAMSRRLSEIEREVGEARYLALGSARNTLAMPAVEGRDLPGPSESDYQRFNAHWGLTTAQAARRWGELQTGLGAPGPYALPELRARLYDMILTRVGDDLALDRVAGDPGDELARAVALVKVIEDPAVPRPAEVHDLVMLQRDAPKTATPAYYKIAGLAVLTRRLAERTAASVPTEPETGAGAPAASAPIAHAHSAQVFPWVRVPLARADEERRLGTDLLFSSEGADWERARARLETAAGAYREVAAAAAVVREAMALRDEVLPVLPAYSRWVARRSRDGDGLVELTERLWDDLHALLRALEVDTPDFDSIRKEPRATDADPHPLSLAERVRRVRAGYDGLVRGFAAACDRALRADSADAWAALDDALGVPFVDFPPALKVDLPELVGSDRKARYKLISAARRVSPRVLGQSAAAAAPEALSEAEARREARLALAALGRAWFEANAGQDDPGFERARTLGGPALAALGTRVGERSRAIAAELVKVLIGLRSANRAGELQKADRLARLLDGAGSEVLARHVQPVHLPGALAPTVPRGRLTAYRRFQARAFLLAQAGRALDDHWADERDGAARPYYAALGLSYLVDAEVLDVDKLWPEGPVAELRGRLTRPDRLVLDGPERYAWTSERQVDFAYRVRSVPADSPRHGYPVLWMAPTTGLSLAAPAADTRFAFAIGPGASPRLPARLEDPPHAGASPAPADSPRESTSTAHGLFRGQRFDLTTRIDLHRVPETVAARLPRPSTARVAVRAEDTIFDRSGLSRGAVAFVLDASGSMGPPEGQAYNESTRYATATHALEGVLREMPAGTTVSLYVFGEAAPGDADVPAEQTIRTVRPPTRWAPEQLAPLMAEISYPRVKPWNDSPIVRTMLRARDDLLRLSDVGLKTMVVITDGVDNRFEFDPLRGPGGKDVATFLRESFKDAGIQINIIAIPQTQPELVKQLQGQFQVILDLPIQGRFYDANRSVDLVTSLRTVFRQELTYRVVREDRQPIPGVSALDVTVSRLDADDIWCPWPLAPGGYRVQVNGDAPMAADVALDGGDLLLVTLGEKGGVPGFRRGLFAQEFYPGQPSQTDRAFRWRLSALQNQIIDDRALRLLTTLERLPDEAEGALRLPRPREVWFEVAAGEEPAGNVLLRWTNREGYPAAAWGLDVPDWPHSTGTDEPARPVLRAWWREGLSSPPADTLGAVKSIAVSLPVDEDRKVELPGGTVVVRGVQVEEHDVEVAPGERRRMPCLVVRLSYPKGKPVWARPLGVNAAGWEHRFYTSADAYTGLFWTTTRDEAFEAVDRLELIGLDTFKRTCEGEGGYIELPLDPPRSGSNAPPPFDDRRRTPAPPAPRGVRR